MILVCHLSGLNLTSPCSDDEQDRSFRARPSHAASCAALCRGNAVEAIGAATHIRLLCAPQQLGLQSHSAADAHVFFQRRID